MKTIITILAIVLSFSSALCQNDTINRIDGNGLKQGYWIYYGKDRPDIGYADTCKIEEGSYVDNRKEGLWRRYNIDGSLRVQGIYHNNRPQTHYSKGGSPHPIITICDNERFDSIVVRLNYANSYGPITDTTITFYPSEDEITMYVDSLSKIDIIDQSSEGEFCSHTINIKIDRYINSIRCRALFNTCRLNDGPGLTARECAEKVFGFK